MKKTFLFCAVFFISSSVFALNLKCTFNDNVVVDKEIKFISDQKVNFCPDRIGIGAVDEHGITISNLIYVKQDGTTSPTGCIYRNHLNVETSCVFIPSN
jgi:hypothetical protein